MSRSPGAARVLAPGGTFACLEFSQPMKWLQLFRSLFLPVIPRPRCVGHAANQRRTST